jgi:propionate CoA-transferase
MAIQYKSACEAVAVIEDHHMVAVSGFVGTAHPEALVAALGQRFQAEKRPRSLGLICSAGQGDGRELGLNHLAREGLVCRMISGHWGMTPKLAFLAMENRMEAYNFPQGVITHLYRDIAAGKPGTITHVGLHTFVDPRGNGGRMNDITTEPMVELLHISGREQLLYKAFPIHIGLLRGTTADEAGNITTEKEALSLELLSIAQAVRRHGGTVIVQVERVVPQGTLHPKHVAVPGILVDVVVVADASQHLQTYEEPYNEAYLGQGLRQQYSIPSLPLDERKVVARRAVQELYPGAVVILGIGMPEGIGYAAEEQRIGPFTTVVDAGPIGGLPAQGVSFGVSAFPDAIMDHASLFDFIDGGGIDVAFLGMAEADERGNVNASQFGGKLVGCGGFINISQNAKKVVFCSTFTAGGLKCAVGDGCLRILKEGARPKFVRGVEQITFHASSNVSGGTEVLYITERAVFRMTQDGLLLTEIAPGIRLEEDVLTHMEFQPIISPELKLMNGQIFQ